MSLDFESLRTWIGREEVTEDVITPVPVAALAATFDQDQFKARLGDNLPPLWHWLFFLPLTRQSEIGPDGHPKRGGFMPPVPLPRRMFAGARFEFHRPLRIGEPMIRKSKITDVSIKEGRTGPLIFVVVKHEIATTGGVALVEENDIVYRAAPHPNDPPQPARTTAPKDAVWRSDVSPDDVMLFRYSALTFNGHRIHYDRRYVTEVEGYPGLVVHGPLIATLLAELLRLHVRSRLKAFRFRAISPLFDVASFSVCGAPQPDNTAILWAQDADGFLAMKAEAVMA